MFQETDRLNETQVKIDEENENNNSNNDGSSGSKNGITIKVILAVVGLMVGAAIGNSSLVIVLLTSLSLVYIFIMEDPVTEDTAAPAVASIETYPVTTTTVASTTTTTTKTNEIKSDTTCTFDCPSGECNWRFDWAGAPECTCKFGEYNTETKVNIETAGYVFYRGSEMRIRLLIFLCR